MSGATPTSVKKEGVSDDDDDLPLSLSKFRKPNKKEPKQELDDDDEPISLVSLKKNMKFPNGNASKVIIKDKVKSSNVKVGGNKVAKVKKEEPEEEGSGQEKPIKKKIKGEATKKKATPAKNAEGKVDKKGRKVYSLPGQRQEPPEERDPLRIFYETLLQQVPTSEMAAIWMMERGLLPEEAAAIVYEKKLRSKQQNIKSPIKVVSAAKTVKVSAKKPKEEPKESPVKPKSKVSKKRKANDDGSDGDDDDDFVLPLKRLKN